MASPPASTKTSLGQKLRERARQRWPQLAGIDIRFRGQFAYITGKLPDGSELPLCRLRYVGYASTWGFAIYRASHDDYQDNFLPSGQPSGTPEEALDCACGLYLGDPTAWLTPPGTDTPTDLQAGALALAEALSGRLRHAAKLADRATMSICASPRPPGQSLEPAALVALAWVHLERNELREAGGRLKQADGALGASPDMLTASVAYLVAACGALAEGRAATVTQIITRARAGRSVPAWLDHQLSLIQSRAYAAAGDLPAAIAAAERAGAATSLEVAVTLAHAWMTAGDSDSAQRALASALAAKSGAPDRVRVQAWLVDAWLSYTSGDRARGRRSLAAALRLAEPEQLRLPFAMERSWIGRVLRHDHDLASTHRCLLAVALPRDQLPAPPAAPDPDQSAILMVEPLSEREREVLRHVSGMLSTTEVASEMHISIHTVKTHMRSILRKLAVAHRGEAVRRARQLGLI